MLVFHQLTELRNEITLIRRSRLTVANGQAKC